MANKSDEIAEDMTVFLHKELRAKC